MKSELYSLNWVYAEPGAGQLNKLRNKLAHELDYEISIEDIDSIGIPLGKEYSKFKIERGEDLKILLCTVIGFICSGLAHFVVEYEAISESKRKELEQS